MPLYTEHLNLTKPTEDEFYNIAVPNSNMDILDERVQQLQEENRALHQRVDQLGEALESLMKKDILEWQDLPLSKNWFPYPSRAQYAKDASNMVHVSGAIRKLNEAPQRSEVIAVLPQGFHPQVNLYYWLFATKEDRSGVESICIILKTNGEICIDSTAMISALEAYTLSFALPFHLSFPAA